MSEPALQPRPADPAVPNAGMAALSRALDSSFRFLRLLMLLVGVLYLGSGFFVVPQDQRAFVLVAGKVRGDGAARILGPGPHWTWPRPIARVVRVPGAVREIRTDAFWPEEPAGQKGLPPDQLPPPGPTLHPKRDGYLLTADASLFHARLALRYRVSDPQAYAFGHADPESVLGNELRRAAMRAAAVTPVDEALRTDSEAFRKRIEDVLRDRAHRLGLGVELERVDLMAIPPRQTQEAFQDVVKARLEAAKLGEEARSAAVRLANEAAAESDRLVSQAGAYKTNVVAQTVANVARFKAVLANYRQNPVIIASLLRQESISRALSSVGEQFVLPAAGKSDQLRLDIPRQPDRRAGEGEAP